MLAICITVYLATYENTTLILFPFFLLVGGITMELFLERPKVEVVDDGTDVKSLGEIAKYTMISLFGMFLVGYAVSFLPLSSVIPQMSSVVNAMLYSALIAISEECFFRGFITDWLLGQLNKPLLAIVASGAVFMTYHFARYGTVTNALIYVFAGGVIMGWAAYQSRRISPCMSAHLLNNVYTYLGKII